jgi:hypothetical protein
MGMGGNIATQSSTIIVRGIATGRVNMNELLRVVLKELRVGIMLGAVYGIFLGVLAFFLHRDLYLIGLVVGLSIFVIMAMAATLGTIIPLVLKRFGFDAAIATGPFVTTAIDLGINCLGRGATLAGHDIKFPGKYLYVLNRKHILQMKGHFCRGCRWRRRWGLLAQQLPGLQWRMTRQSQGMGFKRALWS